MRFLEFEIRTNIRTCQNMSRIKNHLRPIRVKLKNTNITDLLENSDECMCRVEADG